MRTILHLDMDAFFASIEQRDHPEWRGRPVIVGSPPDQRGVVSAASYEARAFGVHSAMPSRTAGRLCPQGIFAPVRMAHYQHVSQQLRIILEQFTPLIEPLSLDEAFLDVTGARRLWPDPVQLAHTIKQRIREQLDLPCSVGIAHNKFLAKLASDLEKPDGLCRVPSEPEAVRAFLAPLPVRRLWGVGKVTEKKLTQHGIRTIGDLQNCPPHTLAAWLGPTHAAHWTALAHGEDERPVEPESEELSLSREHTFAQDCESAEVLRQVLLELTEHVGQRLRKAQRYARCVTLKFRHADFRTHTRQQTLERPVADDRTLLRHALDLLEAQQLDGPIRLIGFGVSRLSDTPDAEPPRQGDLFAGQEPAREKRARDEQLDLAVDALRAKYGRRALRRGDWTLSDG